jgi:OFA family oxalate/formate antiporter-like MFS transporter
VVRQATDQPAPGKGIPIRGNGYRWRQAFLALSIMLLISPYEYCFTIFEKPIATANHWDLPSVATTYTIYIVVASLTMIPSGLWSDRWQPRWFTTVAGVITGAGWILAAFANTQIELYAAYAFGALGPGYIYCNCVNNALKWFPESRGRGTAVGLIDMGFGLGSAIFIPILTPVLNSGKYAYQGAFIGMGIAMMVVIVAAAQFLKYPARGWLPPGYDPAADTGKSARGLGNARIEFTPMQMIRTWQYWWALLGLCFIAAAGLMITAHIAVVAGVQVAVGGAAAGTAAATFSRIPNGVMRWISGSLSDYFGRERLMFIFFVLMGIFTYLMTVATVGWAFILLALLAMGCWGPLFTLYPALVSDYWGRKHSGINYGLIYGPGKGIAGVWAGTVAASLYDSYGSWNVPFEVAAGLAVVSGLMALALRRPSTDPAPRSSVATARPQTAT